ncbi:MAG: glycosyltransferase [Clostridiales bacterium]|nr:glycosyltransferase [Clostridiales bacterium]
MISVIVIGKNEGSRLSACLQSVQDALAVLSHEIIYVDSCSTDDSLDRAKALGARCFLLAERETTAGLGRFVGAREARGDVLLFLDGDMELCPGFCEKALMEMAATGCNGVCGTREDLYWQDGRLVGRDPNYFRCTQRRECPEFGGALMVTAEALSACGGWSTDTVACEEAELHARLKDAGCRITELPIPMIRHNDAVRDNRGLLGAVFSRRRLGEGQAMRCAMALHKGGCYLRHERAKFLLCALDWLSILLLLFGAIGLLASCFIQAAQLGFYAACRKPRAWVSQKLFFFAFPLGLASYRVRSRAYTEI